VILVLAAACLNVVYLFAARDGYWPCRRGPRWRC
jgi:hypothetical protein